MVKTRVGPHGFGVLPEPPIAKSPALKLCGPERTVVVPPVKLLAKVLLIALGATPGPMAMSHCVYEVKTDGHAAVAALLSLH